MHLYAAIFGAGTVGPFASRAFIPAFITAALLRFAPEYAPWFPDDIAAIADQAPTWFTCNTTLIILGLLSVFEVAATKSPDLRAIYQEVDPYAKSLLAFITYLGVAGTQDVEFIESVTQQAGYADMLPAFMIGLGVLWLSMLRAHAMIFLTDIDDADDLRIQGLISWAEDVWAFFGPVLLLLFPIVMLILIGIVAGILAVMRRRAVIKDEQSKIACAHCGQMIYGSALRCFACDTPNPQPRAINFIGRSLDKPAPDAASMPYSLVRKQRCPVCATRLPKRDVHQTCKTCGHELFTDPGFARSYLYRLDKRLPIVLLICFAFSLVPVIGLIPGVIYYRLTLVGPLRRYLPRTQAILLRWVVRVAIFLLIMIQWFPGVGGLVVPAMALLNYGVYRLMFRRALRID